ncbi:mitochondrial ribosomal small subunit component, partial [Teratosphaeriaceae sp. CCFEE 6253]
TCTRVAREEALSTGAFFGPGPQEIGMKLEDQQYEKWKEWAIKEVAALKQLQSGAYTGQESEEPESAGRDASGPGVEREELQEVGASVPGTRQGVEARGGVAVRG